MIKKLLPILLLVSVCLSLFSCNGNGSSPDVTTDGGNTEDVGAILQLVQGGVSEYKICRPSELPADSNIIKACQDLRKAISDKTGANLPITDDWYRDVKDIPEYEILVGDVDRPEMKEAEMISSVIMKDSNFSISISGKKLLIRGGSDDAVCDAVYHLINNFVNKADASAKTLSFSEKDQYAYTHGYRIESLSVAGEAINSYNIVLPENYLISEYRTAIYIKEYLRQMCGVSVPITYDNRSDETYEILIGNTKRSEASALDRHSYSVKVNGTKLYLRAESPYAYDALTDYVTETLFDPHNKSIAIEDGHTFKADVVSTLKGGTENTMKKNGEYRVMFNNMYGSCNETLHPRPQRQQQLYELYLQYDPDVIGLQEHHEKTLGGKHGIDTLLLGAGYSVVKPEGVTGNNFVPIYYKADKLTVIECGFTRYEDGMNDRSKSVTWAVFEGKDGERFCVASTHFWYKSAAEGGEAGRLKDAKQMKEILDAVQSKYNVPVIVGGDFNCNMSSEAYASITEGNYVNAISLAKKADTGRSYHSYPTYSLDLGIFVNPVFPTGDYTKSIDHIFIKGEGLDVATFDVVTDLYALLSTDHCPIYIDFNTK